MKKLSDLNVAEVSLVPRGANKKKFLIFKKLQEAKKDELTAEGRKHIADDNFAIPSEKKYPIHDIAHARNALARVAQNGTSSEQAQVRAAVYRKYPSLKPDKVGKAMSNEIMNLINAVDPETMKKVDTVLKGMKKMKKFKAEQGEDSVIGKDTSGDMLPRKDSAAYKASYKMKKKKAMRKDDMEDVSMGDHQEMGEGEDFEPLSERAQAAVKAISRIAAPFKDELSHDHINAALKEVGFHPGAEDMEQDEEDPHDEKVHMSWAIPENVEEEHHATALDMARKSYKDHLEKMGYRKYPDPSLDETNAMQKSKHGIDDDEDDDEEENVGKISKSAFDLSSFPEKQRAQLESVFKSNAELVRKNADLEKEVKTERDIRMQREFEDRAKGFKHLGVNSSELATILKSLSEKDEKSLEKVERILKAVDNQMASGSGLYREIGSRVSKADGSSAEAKLDSLVDSIVMKGDGTKTREMIYDDVTRTVEGKRLLQECLDERHDAIRRNGAR